MQNKYVLMLCLIGAVIISSCKEDLPEAMQGKVYSFKDVEKNICSKNIKGCVAVDSKTLAFIDEGRLFVMPNSHTAWFAEDVWTGIKGIGQIMRYKNAFLVLLVEDQPKNTTSILGVDFQFKNLPPVAGDVLVVNNDGYFAEIARKIKTIDVDGDDIYAISKNNEVLTHKGHKSTDVGFINNGVAAEPKEVDAKTTGERIYVDKMIYKSDDIPPLEFIRDESGCIGVTLGPDNNIQKLIFKKTVKD